MYSVLALALSELTIMFKYDQEWISELRPGLLQTDLDPPSYA